MSFKMDFCLSCFNGSNTNFSLGCTGVLSIEVGSCSCLVVGIFGSSFEVVCGDIDRCVALLSLVADAGSFKLPYKKATLDVGCLCKD